MQRSRWGRRIVSIWLAGVCPLAAGLVTLPGCGGRKELSVSSTEGLLQEAAGSSSIPRQLEIGELLRRRGKATEAHQVVTRACVGASADPACPARISDCLRELGEPEQARQVALQGLSAFPQVGELHAALGNALVDLKQFAPALEATEKAVELAPQSALAWRARARSLGAVGMWAQVWPAFEEAVRLAPDDGGLLEDYGAFLSTQGRTGEAEPVLRRATALRPDSPRALRLLGVHLARAATDARRQEEAEALLKRTVALAPEDAQAHARLGELLARRGRPDEAVPVLQTALRLDPDLGESWLALGRAQQLAGDREAARDAFERYRRFADYRRENGHLQTRLRVEPGNVELLVRAGELNEKHGRDQQAIAHFRRALSLRPDPKLAEQLRKLELSAGQAERK